MKNLLEKIYTNKIIRKYLSDIEFMLFILELFVFPAITSYSVSHNGNLIYTFIFSHVIALVLFLVDIIIVKIHRKYEFTDIEPFYLVAFMTAISFWVIYIDTYLI